MALDAGALLDHAASRGALGDVRRLLDRLLQRGHRSSLCRAWRSASMVGAADVAALLAGAGACTGRCPVLGPHAPRPAAAAHPARLLNPLWAARAPRGAQFTTGGAAAVAHRDG